MKDRKDIEFTVTKKDESVPILKKILIGLGICIAVAAIAVIVIILSKNAGSSNEYVYTKLEGNNILDMQEYKNNVVLLTQTKTLYLEKNGNTDTGSIFTYSNPVMKVNNGNVLVYDRGGTGFRVEHYRSTLYHEEAPGVIVTAQISKKSTVAFSVDSESDSFSQTCVYIKKNAESELKNIYKSATAYCIAIAISDDDKYVAMAMLDGKNAENTITPVIYNLDTEETVTAESLTGIVLTGFDYLSDNTLAIYTDNCIYHLNKKDFNISVSDSFNSTDYISATINPCGLTAVLLSGNGNKYTPTIKIFEKNGNLKNSVNLYNTVEAVSCSENHCAVLSGNEIYVYSHSGSLIGKITTTEKNKNLCVTDTKLFILQSTGVCIADLTTNNVDISITNENPSEN